MSDTKEHHICVYLQTAVTLRIMELQHAGPFEDWQIEREKERLSKALESGGDDFQFSGGKKGSGASYAAALAESVAFMAFGPGGITVFGDHYEAKFKDSERTFKDAVLSEIDDVIYRENRMNEDQIKQINELLNALQADIQLAIEKGRFLNTIIARGTGGREVALCITQLQQAGHWLTEGQELITEEQGGQS